MPNNEEYLRLPKGIFDHKEEWVRLKRELLDDHARIGRENGADLIELSPVGFASTYNKASHNAGDKVYQMTDKAGRELFLACDSTPGVLRYYCNSYEQEEPSRVSFVAPLFRYRNGPSRHFIQIGYASINEPPAINAIDFPLLQLTGTMVKLCNKIGIRVHIYINDFKALRNLLVEGGLTREDLPEFLHRLQSVSTEQREEMLSVKFKNKQVLQYLLNALVTECYQSIPYRDINDMAEAIRQYTKVDVHINTADLHSVETINGYAIQFKTIEGDHLGDGGQYSDFGNAFHQSIKTLRSVATGIEALASIASYEVETIQVSKLIVFSIDASNSFIIRVLRCLEQEGFSPFYGGVPSNLGREIQKAARKGFLQLVVLGSSEEQSHEIEVKSLTERTTRRIKLSSYELK